MNHLFVVHAEGFPGSYTKLPAPVRVKAEVMGEVADWLVHHLR